LSGNGSVPAATINSGTYLNPGRTNLAGTLTVTNLTTAAGSTLSFDLSNGGATIGSGVNDLLVTTDVNLAPTTTIGLNFLAGYPGGFDRYVLATYSGSASGLANLALDPPWVGTRAGIGLDTGTAGQIALVLTNGTTPGTLTWYGNNPNNNWDRAAALNWNSGTDQFFNADNVVFDDSALTNTVNLVGTLYPGSVNFNNYSGPYTLAGSGQISGLTALTLNGAQPVIIDANNNNTGGVILNGGNTLQIGNADAAGTIGSGDVQALNSSSTLAYNRTDALTLNNRIHGSSGINPTIQANSGVLTLGGSADNAFAIATVSSGGTLVLAKASSSTVHAVGGSPYALTVNAGGTARFAGTGGDQIVNGGNVQLDGILDLNGQNETINNLTSVSGTGIVTNSAAGAAVLSVSSGSAEALFVNGAGGTVGLTTLGASPLTLTNANTATGPLTLVGSGSVYLSNVTAHAWSGTVIFTNTSARLVCDAGNQLAANSVISFGGATAGRVELNGFNQICGGVNDFAGVSGNRIIEAASDGNSNLPGTLTVNVATGVTNSYGSYVRDAAGGAVNSAITLIKSGAGTQTFSGSAGTVSYSGPTTVSNGVLEVSGASSVLANSAVTLAGGTMKFSGGGTRAKPVDGIGTLQVGAGTFITTATNTYTGNTFVSGGTLQVGDGTINGSILTDVTNNGTFKISVATNTVQTYAGVISGTGSFTKDTFGTLYLNGVNTFAGNVTVNAGPLWINNSQGLGLGVKTVNILNGTAGHPELHLNGTNGSIILASTSSFSTSWAGTPAIQNEAGNNVINGNINLTSGGGDTYIAANGGTLTLAGGISPSQANRNLILGGVANGTVSGVISNGTGANLLASLRKVDAGTWTIAGASTHSGPTKVEGGKLVVNGSLGTNTVTVSNNATLGGSGLILGAVSVLDGGVLTPGTTSIGMLTVSNTLTLAATSTNIFRLDAAATTNDSVAGVSAVTYGGTLIVTNIGGTFAPGQSFKLFNATTINPATFASVQLPALTGSMTWTNLLASSGTIAVISTASVATNQVPITFSVAGSTLNLSWPPDHLGWKLQSQTNTLASGLGTNWVTVPGSTSVTNMSIPINVLNGSVFFRLLYP
jgi:autotransporter-associated beta strand protein